MKEVIVVTGATGRVGHLVVERLLAVGHSVRAVGRTADKLTRLAGLGADVRPGSYHDRAFLASAFKGANAAFVLTPVDISAKDVNEVQYKVIEGLVEAIRDSSVRHVVLLSSWGAELATRVGGIIGCYRFEQLLDGIANLNVVHLRPVWFMENFLWNIPLIKMAASTALRSRQMLHSQSSRHATSHLSRPTTSRGSTSKAGTSATSMAPGTTRWPR